MGLLNILTRVLSKLSAIGDDESPADMEVFTPVTSFQLYHWKRRSAPKVKTVNASSTPSMPARAAVPDASSSEIDNEVCEDALPLLEVFMPGTSHHCKHNSASVDMLAEAAHRAVTGIDEKTAVDIARHMEPEQASPAESQVSSPVRGVETPEPSTERPLVARSPCTPITHLCALYSDPNLLDVTPANAPSMSPASPAASAVRQLYGSSTTACAPVQEARPAGVVGACTYSLSPLPRTAAPAQTAATKRAPPPAPPLPQGQKKAPPAPPAMPKMLPGAAPKTAPKPPAMHQAGPVVPVQMKGLHFKKREPLPGSLWDGAQSNSHPRPKIRLDDMRSAFSIRAAADVAKKSAAPKKAASALRILKDDRAANFLGIRVTGVANTAGSSISGVLQDVCTGAILNSKSCAEVLDQLLKTMPDKALLNQARSFEGDKSALILAERFLVQVAACKRLTTKAECLLYMNSFKAELAASQGALASIANACAELNASLCLKAVMLLVLDLGNSLNHGTAKDAVKAFDFEILGKLKDKRANKGAIPGVAHFLAFAAYCVIKTMDAATLHSFIQKGGYLADLISLQAAVRHIEADAMKTADKLRAGFTRIPAERAACIRTNVRLDCPAGLMLSEPVSEESAAKPARMPLGELTTKGADNSPTPAPPAALRPAALHTADKENAPAAARLTGATKAPPKAPPPPPRKAPPKAPPPPPCKAAPPAPPPPPRKAAAAPPKAPAPPPKALPKPLAKPAAPGVPPQSPPPKKAGAKAAPKAIGGSFAEQLAAKKAAKAAAHAVNAKVTVRLTAPTAEDPSLAAVLAGFEETAGPQLDALAKQAQATKVAMNRAAVLFNVNPAETDADKILLLWKTVGAFVRDFNVAFLEVAKAVHPEVFARASKAKVASAAKVAH